MCSGLGSACDFAKLLTSGKYDPRSERGAVCLGLCLPMPESRG